MCSDLEGLPHFQCKISYFVMVEYRNNNVPLLSFLSFVCRCVFLCVHVHVREYMCACG